MSSTAGNPSQTISPRVIKPALSVARLVLIGSAAVLLVLGVVIWTGNGDQLIPLHVVFGSTLVIALWVIAGVAWMAGVSRRVVAFAFTWSLVVPFFGLVQDRVLEGDWHWTIQALHLVVGMSLAGLGQALMLLIHRRQTAKEV